MKALLRGHLLVRDPEEAHVSIKALLRLYWGIKDLLVGDPEEAHVLEDGQARLDRTLHDTFS